MVLLAADPQLELADAHEGQVMRMGQPLWRRLAGAAPKRFDR